MFHAHKTNGAFRSAVPASRIAARARAAPQPGLPRIVAMLLYAGAAIGGAAFIFDRISTALDDPLMAGLLTSLIAITLLPFLGLGEERAS